MISSAPQCSLQALTKADKPTLPAPVTSGVDGAICFVKADRVAQREKLQHTCQYGRAKQVRRIRAACNAATTACSPCATRLPQTMQNISTGCHHNKSNTLACRAKSCGTCRGGVCWMIRLHFIATRHETGIGLGVLCCNLNFRNLVGSAEFKF